MVVLVAFALLAGAGTALSPCVLPVLPALLSASASGGRRRPVGIAIGLAVTFAVTIVGLASVIDGVGLGPGATRTLAVVVLIAFGVVTKLGAILSAIPDPLVGVVLSTSMAMVGTGIVCIFKYFFCRWAALPSQMCSPWTCI